jgi:hypothetical protein
MLFLSLLYESLAVGCRLHSIFYNKGEMNFIDMLVYYVALTVGAYLFAYWLTGFFKKK